MFYINEYEWIWYDMEWMGETRNRDTASVSVSIWYWMLSSILWLSWLCSCSHVSIGKLWSYVWCLLRDTLLAAQRTVGRSYLCRKQNLWIHIITKYHFSSLKLYVIFTKTYFWHCLLFHASRWTTRSILYTGTPTQIIWEIFWRRWVPMIPLQM